MARRYAEHVEAHTQVWPGVLAMIHDCNIRNHSIFAPVISDNAMRGTSPWANTSRGRDDYARVEDGGDTP